MSRAVRRKKSGNNTSQGGSGGGSGGGKRTKTIDLGWTRNNKKRDEYDNDDDHIDSDSEVEGRKEPSLEDENARMQGEETLDAKKVRLAREYLRKLEADEEDDDDDDSKSGSGSSSSDEEEEDEAEDVHERIGIKLQRERLKREGMLERAVADRINQHITRMTTTIRQGKEKSTSATTTEQQQQQDDAKDWIESGYVQLLKGHDLTPTCVALQSNGERAISASKDHSVIVWDVERGQCAITLADTWKKQSSSSGTSAKKNQDRTMGEVLSVACSDDGRYAAIGKRDATVCIYDVRTGGNDKNKLIKTFTGHKGPVTCLAFRTQSLQLFSGSDDRCIR
jgi:ribosomal RNA-processing protein 9